MLNNPLLEVEYLSHNAHTESAEELLSYRKADIVVSSTPINSRSVVCQPLCKIECVLACRADHPRLGNSDDVSTETLLKEKFTQFITPHVVIQAFQQMSDHNFVERKIGFRTDSLMSLAEVIHQTDLIGYIPTRLFETLKSTLNLKAINCSIDLPEVMLYITYNRASLNTPLFAKVIEKLTQLQADE